MANRIDITYKIKDTRSGVKKKHFESLGIKGKIDTVVICDSYTIDAALNNEQIDVVAHLLINPLIETYSINLLPAVESFDWVVEIGLLPGVTDNIGATARETIEDYFGRAFANNENVYASRVYFITGSISKDEILTLANQLYNPLIERVTIQSFDEVAKTGKLSTVVPKVELQHTAQTLEIDINVDDHELEKIGSEGILNPDNTRRGPLSLGLPEMKAIQAYFKKEKRNPTDIELETLAQTWSEHCKHTIFNDPLDDIADGLYKTYIKRATEKIRTLRQARGERDFCVSVFTDNSGAIEFDKNYLITHKVETHNSPSALDPYGGALTGIVGVNRDALGFGLGAKPIANTYGFCFADPNDTTPLYRDKNKTELMLSPKRILEGVVEGVNVGGNSSGIPTPLGFVFFDDRFKGKPLVFVGTVGLIPKKSANRPAHIKKARPGDYIVVIGGRVGLDGIHGATFSSESLNTKSQTSSVQIGDPITQKKFSDAIVYEARDMGLYNSITDNGAGGLSSSVGEMSEQSGGCIVNLEKVPLKYPGLDPWQIWISESQERMTLAVPQQKWRQFADLMKSRGVEATIIGEFNDSGRCVVNFDDTTVLDIRLEFLHDGRPKKQQKSKKPTLSRVSQQLPPLSSRASQQLPPLSSRASQQTSRGISYKIDSGQARVTTATLEQMLTRLNICGYEFISTQFDHTVQGTAVIGPLQGKGRINGEASVIKPLFDSDRGVVLSNGLNPTYSDSDTYYMAATSIDSAIRSAVSVGANPEFLAILDNFCWSSSDKPEQLYKLKRAAEACYDYAVMYQTPFISGKDSMFNDFKGFDAGGKPIHIAAPPTLLISAIGVIPDVLKSVTLDFKNSGDLIYLIGNTHDEIGQSEYAIMMGVDGIVPMVNGEENRNVYQVMYKAIQKELIASAISISRGGLGVAISKSAIGGMTGCEVDLSKLSTNLRNDILLFSESQGRLLVSINPKNKTEFEIMMGKNPHTFIGTVTNKDALLINGSEGKNIVNLSLKKANESYKSEFKDY